MQSNPSNIIEFRINAKLQRLLELQRVHANIIFHDGEGHEGHGGAENSNLSLLKNTIPLVSDDLLQSIRQDQELLLSILSPLSPNTTTCTSPTNIAYSCSSLLRNMGHQGRYGNPPLSFPCANNNGILLSGRNKRKDLSSSMLQLSIYDGGTSISQQHELISHSTNNGENSLAFLGNKKRRIMKENMGQQNQKNEERRNFNDKDEQTPQLKRPLLPPSLGTSDSRQVWSFAPLPSRDLSTIAERTEGAIGNFSTAQLYNQEAVGSIIPFASSVKKQQEENKNGYNNICQEIAPDQREKELLSCSITQRNSFVPSVSNCTARPTSEKGKPLVTVTTGKKRSTTERSFFSLGMEQDEYRLSKFLCFLRSECIEVFTATEDNVYERMSSKKVQLGQVGVRCRFCADLPSSERAGRSSNYPSSIDRLYQGVSMMIYKHFPICREILPEIQEKFKVLRNSTKKGDVESRSYWISSAKERGLVDCGDEGIRLKRASSPDCNNEEVVSISEAPAQDTEN